MLSKIEWPTALVVGVGIAALAVAAIKGVPKETIAAIGAVAVSVAAAMKALVKADDSNKKDGPK